MVKKPGKGSGDYSAFSWFLLNQQSCTGHAKVLFSRGCTDLLCVMSADLAHEQSNTAI